MVKKIFGKHFANCKFSSNGGAVLNRTLEVYLTKKFIKGVLWNSGIKGWREEPHKPIKELKFNYIYGVEHTIKSMLKNLNAPEDTKIEKEIFHNYGTIKN